MTENGYSCCTRCVMDTTASGIHFDEEGRCNYCTEFIERWLPTLRIQGDYASDASVQNLVARIKSRSKKRDYDCIIGISGGVDSSWVLVQAVKNGLRPLAVHMDNGWNTVLPVGPRFFMRS